MIGVIKYNKRTVKFRKELNSSALSSTPAPILVVTELMLQGCSSLCSECDPIGSLSEWLTSYSDGITLKKKLQIAKQVAMGMKGLHASTPPIIHHNLKSSNVVV